MSLKYEPDSEPQETKDEGDDIFKQLTSKLGGVFVTAEEDNKKVFDFIFKIISKYLILFSKMCFILFYFRFKCLVEGLGFSTVQYRGWGLGVWV